MRSTAMVTAPALRVLALLERAVDTGPGSRRNARAGMTELATRRRERLEAEASVEAPVPAQRRLSRR